MADFVREIMEKMVPALRDLQRKGVFSPAEVASIVERREGYEYGLRKRQVEKVSDLLCNAMKGNVFMMMRMVFCCGD